MVHKTFTITPDAANVPQCVTKGTGITKVKQFLILLRSLGTATYVSVGGRDSQDRKFVSVGDNISETPIFGEHHLNLSDWFIVSDTNDAVVEVVIQV